MNKIETFGRICQKMQETYAAKNSDYGDSFAKTRSRYPDAICIRLEDKLWRLEQLIGGKERRVADETIADTLLDLANYAVMELVEMEENGK